MADRLSEIIANTRRELEARKAKTPLAEVRSAAKDAPPARDFAAALRRGAPVAIIAEVKGASPSKGVIRTDFDPVAVALEYEEAGASAISVLTDEKYFHGKLEYLAAVRRRVSVPVLRKDFLVDAYQVSEARANGADAVLLISEASTGEGLRALLDLAHSLGMNALVESHDREHLEAAIASGARVLGINNRNLRTLEVDLSTTEKLAPIVPKDRILVSESGISSRRDVERVQICGVSAVLVGETLMRSSDVRAKMDELLGRGA